MVIIFLYTWTQPILPWNLYRTFRPARDRPHWWRHVSSRDSGDTGAQGWSQLWPRRERRPPPALREGGIRQKFRKFTKQPPTSGRLVLVYILLLFIILFIYLFFFFFFFLGGGGVLLVRIWHLGGGGVRRWCRRLWSDTRFQKSPCPFRKR